MKASDLSGEPLKAIQVIESILGVLGVLTNAANVAEPIAKKMNKELVPKRKSNK